MNKLNLSTFVFFIAIFSIMAQKFEFGINFGGGNYIGDIGSEYYFKPNKLGGGLVFKNTVNPWYLVRIDVAYQQFEALDSQAESLGRQARNFNFDGFALTLATGIEYNFIPFNPYKTHKGHWFRPYMYSGIGISSYSGHLFKNNTPSSSNAYGKQGNFSGSAFFIPMKLGIKYKVAEHFLIGVETGANYYLTDNLDGSQNHYEPSNIIENKITPSTNTKSNDWSTFTSISFIYTFGDLRCYFNL